MLIRISSADPNTEILFNALATLCAELPADEVPDYAKHALTKTMHGMPFEAIMEIAAEPIDLPRRTR